MEIVPPRQDPPAVTSAPIPSDSASSWRVVAARALPAAAVASVTALAVSLVAGLLFGMPILAQALGDHVAILIPFQVFASLLQIFGHQAKHLFFAGLVIVQGVLTMGVLALYWVVRARIVARLPRGGTPQSTLVAPGAGRHISGSSMRAGFGDAAALIAILWLVASIALAPLLTTGGTSPGFLDAWQTSLVATGMPGIVAALVFVWLSRREPVSAAVADTSEARMTRRSTLRTAGIVLVAVAGGAAAWQVISSFASQLGLGRGPSGATLRLGDQPSRIVPPPTPNYGDWAPVKGQSPDVTPPDQFYYVSKNLASDPSVASATWQLAVSGLVQQSLMLRYADLRAMPAVEQYQTLECISNEVGGNLMSNGRWTGVSLAHILDQAGVRPGATHVIFRCADGYSDSVHIAQATGPHALVAYQLDGAPLAQPHGFPARLLVPGLYGMKNGKWLNALEVTDAPYQGYWEHQGWTPEAVVKTTSRIDAPADGDLLKAGSHAIAGVAFSGNRGISRVDVSLDAGATWQTATLRRPLAEQTWVLWESEWNATPGTYVIVVRAIETDGSVQTPAVSPTLPDGASGYYSITVTVN